MARYTESVCRQCRREGEKLFLKGERCYSNKCAMVAHSNPPGQHGAGRRAKPTEYALQLREKQKVKRIYGMQEKQFHHYFELASRMRGITGENLLILLERRLDNVVYRLGLADSRAQARQFVTHGHIQINGKKASIPSMFVKVGDVITVKQQSQSIERIKALREGSDRVVPKWLQMDYQNLTGKVVALAAREDIEMSIEEHLIVELYSR